MLGLRFNPTSDEAVPLQRMKSITTVMSVVSFGLVVVVLLAGSLDPWWHAAILAPSLVACLWVVSRWYQALNPRILIPVLILCEITWIAAVLFGLHPLSMVGLAVVGAIAITTHDVNRTRAALLLSALVAGTGLLTLAVNPAALSEYTWTPALYAAGIIAVFWINDLTWRLFTELDAMRRTEAELAVVKERFRFASDLHDIQGHTLHVIKLKAAVAARLQQSDPERTAAELAEIQRLTAETIDQARELANSTHRLSFVSELANAGNLLEAAGIKVRVDRQSTEPVARDAMFALVLREATTNILRHSQAREVEVTVTREQLDIRNDGAAGQGNPLRGLDVLRLRVGEAGGVLEHAHTDGNFTLTARFGE